MVHRFKEYEELPEGWKELKGATTAPNGYIIISNNKSWFTGERKIGIIKIEKIRSCLLNDIESNLRKGRNL